MELKRLRIQLDLGEVRGLVSLTSHVSSTHAPDINPRFLHFKNATDSIDCYLFCFEKAATSYGWSSQLWVVHPSSLLTGKTLELRRNISRKM